MDVYTDKDHIMTLDEPVTVAVMLTYLPSCDYKTVYEYPPEAAAALQPEIVPYPASSSIAAD